MKMHLVGYTGLRKGTFNGFEYENKHLYLSYNTGIANDVIGGMVVDKKVSKDFNTSGLVPDTDYDVDFDMRGNICSMTAL